MNKMTKKYSQHLVSDVAIAFSNLTVKEKVWQHLIEDAGLENVPENMVSRTTFRNVNDDAWILRIEWITFEPEPLFEDPA